MNTNVQRWPWFILGILATCNAGCVSSTLKVQVDVYRDDPLVSTLASPERLAATRELLRETPGTAAKIVEGRKKLSTIQVDIIVGYTNVMQAVNGLQQQDVRETESIRGVMQAQQEFEDDLERRLSVVRVASARAMSSLERFASIAGVTAGDADYSPLAFFDALDDMRLDLEAVDVSFRQLLPPTDPEEAETHFEEIVHENLSDLQSQLKELSAPDAAQKYTDAVGDEIDEVLKTLSDAASVIAELETQGVIARTSFSDAVGALVDAKSRQAPGAVGESMTQVIEAAQAAASSPGFAPSGERIVARYGRSMDFYTSQIDRLQDPADPAWRILTNPQYQDRWQPYINLTEYYAEGNAEVVIVRDRIGHYRVQRGKNNPAATILSQARMARSLASSTLDVLAAAAGVSGIPGLSGVADKLKPDQPDAAAATATAAESPLAAEAHSEVLSQARRALVRELSMLRRDVAAVAAGSDVGEEAKARLVATLGTYHRLLSSMEAPD